MKHHRFLSIFLTVFALATLLCIITPKAEAATVASGTCGVDLTWVLDDEGTLTISGTGYSLSNWTINSSYPQTPPWYANRTSIKTIIFEADVKTIGSNAFYGCRFLETIVWSNSITSIGEYAFDGCDGLTDLVIPDSVEEIGNYAFYGCDGLTNLVIPNSVARIGKYAFKYCYGLTSVIFGEESIYISDGAFQGCVKLEEISIPDNVTLGELVFAGCGLETVHLGSDRAYIPNYTFSGCTNLSSVGFLKNIKRIGVGAFSGCTGLTTLNCMECVTTIGGQAFQNCTNLIEAELPDTVTSMGAGVFSGCNSLQKLTIPFIGDQRDHTSQKIQYPLGYIFGTTSYTGSKYITQEYYGSDGRSTQTAYYFPTSLSTVIVNGGNITYGAFSNISSVVNVFIGDNVSKVESGAFTKCGLKSVSISENVEVIGLGAFQGCTGLTNLSFSYHAFGQETLGAMFGLTSYYSGKAIEQYTYTTEGQKNNAKTYYVPGGLTTVTITGGIIPCGAFYNFDTIKTLYLGSNVTHIGTDAFYNCKITEVHIEDLKAWCELESDNYYSTPLFYGGKLYLDDVLLDDTLIDGDLIIPEGTAKIGNFKFYSKYITSVRIPDSVTSIGMYAFYSCSALTSVTIGNSVTSIGKYAFCSCSALTSVTIGNSVESMGDYAFKDCFGLTSVTIPDSVTSIGMYTFDGCSALTSLTIGNSVESIGGCAFKDCFGLTSVTIPDSVTSIGSNVLSGCRSIEQLTIPFVGNCKKTNADYPQYPFGYIFGTSSGTGMQAYSQKYHYGPTSTVSVTYYVPASLKTVTVTGGEILYGALSGCKDLSLTLGDGVTSIPDNAFEDCSGLKSITIGNGVKSIGARAFEDCTGLVSLTIGQGVTSIGNRAFSGCTALTRIYFNAENITPLRSYNYVFSKVGQEGLGIELVVGSSVTVIPDFLFCPGSADFAPKITNIEFEKNSLCLSVGKSAFQHCVYLESVKLPDSVTAIGTDAFMQCKGLQIVELGDGVKDIGLCAFDFCTNLHTLKTGNNITNIENFAFRYSKISTVRIPENVVKLAGGVFYDCAELNNVLFIGSAPKFGSDVFYNVTATAYYPACNPTWTEEVRQNYGGTITWVAYDGLIDVGGTEYMSFADALAACGEGQYLKLNSNTLANAVLSKDLYIDLNGFDLSGTIKTNGYKVYGMDSTTNAYTCENRGVFSCVDENGKAIIPVTHFKSDITGSVKRYMAIKDGNGYSFHRFYLGITHLNLKPGTTGVGYKAVFYGDEMVAANLDSFGYTMTLGDRTPLTAMKAASSFVSGKTVTLRIDNYDVEQYSQTDLTACVVLKLADGTVIESTAVTMTFRGLMEQLNANYTALTAEQLNAVAEMIKKYAIIISWDLKNLIAL